jgi:O-acetyl-ADP-ribose deacetylase (regulator of RNase III)
VLGLRRHRGVQVDLYQGDLSLFACDAMVNAANPALAGGRGVDGALHAAGGPEILAACRALGRGCPTGSAVATTAGRLPAQWLIHTVGPVWTGGSAGEAALLASAYRASLAEAERLALRHVAFPSLSTGAYGYPVEAAAVVAFAAVRAHIEERTATAVGRVTLVLFSLADYKVYQKALFAAFADEP